MNIGSIKPNDDGVYIGRIATMNFVATVALQAVQSNNERAPAYDVMGLSVDRRSWVKIGALWQFNSNSTGEAFLSGRVDDPSLDKPISIALFEQDDGSFNIAWQREQRKRSLPGMESQNEDSLPPLTNAGSPATGGSAETGDGLGESTAPEPKKAKASAKKETADA